MTDKCHPSRSLSLRGLAHAAWLCALLLLAAHASASLHELPETIPAWIDGYEVRYALQERLVLAEETKTVIARLPVGGWLPHGATSVPVQTADGQVLTAAVLGQGTDGDATIQFPRPEGQIWFWAYVAAGGAGSHAQAISPELTQAIQHEGLTREVRPWGDQAISTWAEVRDGLTVNDKALSHQPIAWIWQNGNPVRQMDPTKFATVTRGALRVTESGRHRFFVNATDAAFLFVNGFLVQETGGSRRALAGRIPRESVGYDVDLEPGVHRIEVFQVVGDRADGHAQCMLLWIPPNEQSWRHIPRQSYVQPAHAAVAKAETRSGRAAPVFMWGVDDTLFTDALTVHLLRFQAHAHDSESSQLRWQMGDAFERQGASIWHPYFEPGVYSVTLRDTSQANLPPFVRETYAWPAPGMTGPLSLERIAELLTADVDWRKLDDQLLHQLFALIELLEVPQRWPLLEVMGRHLLTQQGLDRAYRSRLYAVIMEAMAQQGKGREALTLLPEATAGIERLVGLYVELHTTAARIEAQHLREPDDAIERLENVVTQHRRAQHPSLRRAALLWGDILAEAGELAEAGQMYELAATLGDSGSQGVVGTGQAITSGANLRIAEQQLRSDNLRDARVLLSQIELDHPVQKLDGLFRFLQAETARLSGSYDEALREYQMLLRLRQWAGYRDRAIFGMADTFYRQGDYVEAMRWFDALEERFTSFFEERGLAEYRDVIRKQMERLGLVEVVAEEGVEAVTQMPLFTGFSDDFGPREIPPGHEHAVRNRSNIISALGLGMDGRHVGAGSDRHNIEFNRPVANMTSQSWYWVEYWTRIAGPYHDAHNLHAWLFGEPDNRVHAAGGTIVQRYWVNDDTSGRWQRFGFLLRSPIALDGIMRFALGPSGIMPDFSALRIEPLSDAQYFALLRFQERGVEE